MLLQEHPTEKQTNQNKTTTTKNNFKMLMEVVMETFWGNFNVFFFYLAGVNEAADASEARCPPVGEDPQPALGDISPSFMTSLP